MEKVILVLERMGFFYDSICNIIEEGNEIYCKAQNAFASCSAPEFGMGAYCPLYEFRVKKDDPTILRWVNINEELGKCLLKLVKSGEDQEDPPPAGGAAMPSPPPEDEKNSSPPWLGRGKN